MGRHREKAGEIRLYSFTLSLIAISPRLGTNGPLADGHCSSYCQTDRWLGEAVREAIGMGVSSASSPPCVLYSPTWTEEQYTPPLLV